METSTIHALDGIRVLEIADQKGVYCGKLLGDMGADVVKIEIPGGDPTRAIPPFWQGQPSSEGSLFFLYYNTNKRGITLDITRTEGQAVFKRLAKTAHIIVETCSPHFMDSLGLGYSALSEDNSALVLTSITGFGQTGPHSHFKSSDLVASALGGAMHCVGDPDDPPVRIAGRQANIVASLYGAISSLMAHYHALAYGQGQHVDISMEEAMVAVTHMCGVAKWLQDGIIPKRRGGGLFAVPCGVYPCQDGLAYVMSNSPIHWKVLARWINEVTGNEEILDPMLEGNTAGRVPYREVIDLFVTEFTSRFPVAELCHEGQRRHLTITPVNTMSAAIADPHLAARNYFVAMGRPGMGVFRYPGAPFQHSITPWQLRRVAPTVGQHNAEIYGELGIPAETLAAWRATGII